MEQARKEENRIDKRAINKIYFFAVPSMMLDDGYLPVVARCPIPHDLAKLKMQLPIVLIIVIDEALVISCSLNIASIIF